MSLARIAKIAKAGKGFIRQNPRVNSSPSSLAFLAILARDFPAPISASANNLLTCVPLDFSGATPVHDPGLLPGLAGVARDRLAPAAGLRRHQIPHADPLHGLAVFLVVGNENARAVFELGDAGTVITPLTA